MEEERVYNEMSHSHQQVLPQGLTAAVSHRTRTVSSPVPLATACSSGLQQSPAVCGSTGRPLSPGLNYGERRDLPLPVVGGRPDVFTPPSMGRLHHSYNSPPGVSMVASPSPPPPQVWFTTYWRLFHYLTCHSRTLHMCYISLLHQGPFSLMFTYKCHRRFGLCLEDC